MENEKKFKILFLCTGNSCCSQMAEGFARHLLHIDQIDAYSAGIDPKRIDPRAIKVMAEVGIDISRQQSKSKDDLKDAVKSSVRKIFQPVSCWKGISHPFLSSDGPHGSTGGV